MYKYTILNCFMFIILLTISSCDDKENNIYETGHKTISLIKENDESVQEIIVDPAQRSQVVLQAKTDNLSAFGIVVEVETNSSLIDSYNKANNTNYQELSPNSYSFETSDFIFPRYSEVSSHINITLNSTGMDNEVKYLLPVQMITITGDPNVNIDPNNDIVYIVISKLPPP